MAKTIVGVFDDANSAQTALRELQGIGIPQSQLRLTSNDQASSSASGETDTSWKDRIVHFFESMFENESDRNHANTYAEAWRRGHYLVVADVDDMHMERAVEILNRLGAIDIDRRAQLWTATGYSGTYDRAAPPYTAEQRERELASYKKQSEAIPVVQEELAVGKQVVQRGGVRVHSYTQERPVEEVAAP